MDISNIYDAKEVLKDVISKTPLVHADKLHENLWIKAENLQGTGAFKLRGAYHKLHSDTKGAREGRDSRKCRKPCTGSRLFLHEDGNQGNDRYAENRSAV